MLRGVLALLFAFAVLPAAAQRSETSESLHHHSITPPAHTTPDTTPAPATAGDSRDDSERIIAFDSDITVAKNGTMTVAETIQVHATNDIIKHGIYRDFPTRYTDKHGANVHVRFDVVSATMDGHDEPYATEDIDNGVRVKIGDKDSYVDVGDHTYVLTYITSRQIGFFDKYDELYWNVTGNGWVLPIGKASATVRLPKGARILQNSFYTGVQGSTEQDATADPLSGDTIRFVTTRPLEAYEGLTIAVGFAKGAVMPPSAEELRRDFIVDNAGTFVAVLGVAVLAIFFLAAWWHVGRDPKRGTIIPLFAPPAGLSPESVRFIHKMAYDRKAFAAALINMAVKGFLTISDDDEGTYTLKRTGKTVGDCALSPNEIAMADALFDELNASIELKQTNHTVIQRAITALKTGLKNECEAHYFVTNAGWFAGGIVILALTAIASALLAEDPGTAIPIMLWVSGWSVGTAFLLHQAWQGWQSVIYGPGSRIVNFFEALIPTLFAVLFTGGLSVGYYWLALSVSTAPFAILGAGGGLAYLFYHLLKAPTSSGAAILDQIDGFKLFLVTAEKDRLEMLNPPNVTPEVFEKFLPYAIALDCENQWSKKFEAEAAAAGASADNNYGYTPAWYYGSNFGNLGTSGFVSSIGSSIGSAAASASTAPGSSSGSGGGGFSGGGGGGGGGGGW